MTIGIEEQEIVKNRRLRFESESRWRLKRRKIIDRTAKWVIGAGGFAIIISILAILIFISLEIWPLFQAAKVQEKSRVLVSNLVQGLPFNTVAFGLDENQEIGYLLSDDGRLQFFDAINRRAREQFDIATVHGEVITSVWQSLNGKHLMLGTNRGRALELKIDFNTRFFDGKRSYQPRVTPVELLHLDAAGRAIKVLVFAHDEDGSKALAGITEDHRVELFLLTKEESLFGDAEIDSARFELEAIWSDNPRSLALDRPSGNLYLGTSDGKIYHWKISLESGAEFVSVAKAAEPGTGVGALQFLIGNRTLMVGDSQGHLSAWFLVRDSTAATGRRLRKIRQMQPLSDSVTALAASARGKGFIAGDSGGELSLQYSTSERTLARFNNGNQSQIVLINYAPKSNGALTLDSRGTLTHWQIHNPHPEAGLKAFFGKVWYEGYDQPEYVWQSTGGSDEFEPKLSLVPLIFGSLKGTLYALIIAVPLAILGALYTSQFMHPLFRSYVKPAVEIMAALPSVVLGFLAGLWLAPIIEDIVPGILSMAVGLPLMILLTTLLWTRVPQSLRGRFRPGIESLLLLPVLLLGIWFCLSLSHLFESALFAGDFKHWLRQTLNLPFDQRNALVVGFAMGFAVIPIIYTISEDALSNVPQNLISGSLALGASRWQTAVRVVIPTAAAGIFSAVMIGFGRAVGETMIVLMATGNTPIMDWNIFNGFRTLSANIAVEIPEAPVGGSLYRVLFLAAMLLFVITFLVNTLAEMVRQKLREKYQKL